MSPDVPEVVNDNDDQPEEIEDEGVDEPIEDENETNPEVDEATVDLTDDDFGGDLFDGVEDDGVDESADSADVSDSSDEDGGEVDESPEDVLGANADAIEESINEGVARLAVVGLSDDDLEDSDMTKKGLENEFTDVFETFRLGHFGSQFIVEYVLEPSDGDIDPTWGLLGSAMMATAMVVWLRPDGTEAIGEMRDQIEDLAGGVL